MSAHTPGPWRITEINTEGFAHVSSSEHGFGDIATTWNDQHKANAHLIAAAPDMLAALKECDSRCRYDGDYFHDIGDTARQDASWAAADAAEAAIAKAEGQS